MATSSTSFLWFDTCTAFFIVNDEENANAILDSEHL